MKRLFVIFLALPYIVLGQCDSTVYGVLGSEVIGNSVILKNDSVIRNCASWHIMEVFQLTEDTLVWLELDQGGLAQCDCNFNLSVTVDSLEAGSYIAKTYYGYYLDTCFIGLIPFTITNINNFSSFVVTGEYQSDCFFVGTEDQKQPENPQLRVLPNPSSDKINVSSCAITGNTMLSISNVNGEKVIERQLTNTETQIDISPLPRGVYFVRMQNENMIEVRKIVKQ